MSNEVIVSLSQCDRDRIIRALRFLDLADAALQGSTRSSAEIINHLSKPVELPKVTVGVHGGQVQWIIGNPFPIMICDYDGDECDLHQIDIDDQKCRSWFEPADSDWKSAVWLSRAELTT